MNDLNSKKKYDDDILSVSDFLERVNVSLLSFNGSRVKGEVTSIKSGYSWGIFFTIKDANESQLNCIVWKSDYERSGVDVKEGDEIIVTGMPEIYPQKGTFSLKTRTIEYAGEGVLKKAYEELRKKLTKEGLFDLKKKRELPKYPKKIGVITSKAGVVMQDFSSNLGHYGFEVTSVDSRVEGKDAIHEILASVKALAKEDIEVLVIMRGGGSWESLQSFNTESVVRAIAGFKCPVLTGIGHDVDVTLAELAADVGKSTPTAVAEALNESWDTMINTIKSAEKEIIGEFKELLSNTENLINNGENTIFRFYQMGLSSFEKKLNIKASKIRTFFIELERRISQANTVVQRVVGIMRFSIREKKKNLRLASLKIVRHMSNYASYVEKIIPRIFSKVSSGQRSAIKIVKNSLGVIKKNIKIFDPEHNLKLGYSISYLNGKLIRSIKGVSVGGEVETRLSDGKLISEIKDIK